jgi:hypothetical protein
MHARAAQVAPGGAASGWDRGVGPEGPFRGLNGLSEPTLTRCSPSRHQGEFEILEEARIMHRIRIR